MYLSNENIKKLALIKDRIKTISRVLKYKIRRNYRQFFEEIKNLNT